MLVQPRQVHFRTILGVLRSRSIILMVGAIFFLVGVGMFTVFTIVFSALDDGTPKVDYEKTAAEGLSTDAEITGIEVDYNTSINQKHPTVVTYRYSFDGKMNESKMKTLSEEVSTMKVGDDIRIKLLDGGSMIEGLEPFEFPVELFYILPGIFLVIGLPFILIMIINIRRDIWLLKYGKVSDGELLSVVYKPGSYKNKSGRGLQVSYRYTGDSGKTHIGEAFTPDLSLAPTMKQGDNIKIFVSPIDERRSTMISKLEAARNNWNIVW